MYTDSMDYIPYSAANLVLAREEVGASRKMLANASGLTETAIGYYEREMREPGLGQLKLLSWALSKLRGHKTILYPEFDNQITTQYLKYDPGEKPE